MMYKTTVLILVMSFFSSFDGLKAQEWESDTENGFLYTTPSSTRVGIGTSTPSTAFHINGFAGLIGVFQHVDREALYFKFNQDGSDIFSFGVNQGGEFTFSESGALGTNDIMTLVGGEVGIGTSNPGELLHVNGVSKFGQRIQITGNTIPASGAGLEIGFSAGEALIESRTRPGGSTYNDLRIKGEDLMFNIKAAEVMRIRNNKRVGIGVSNPSHKFHVQTDDFDYVAHFENTRFGTGEYDPKGILVEVDQAGTVIQTWKKSGTTMMEIAGSGLLSVNGEIKGRELNLTQTGWPDYVFDEGYDLMSLEELEQFVEKEKHLPGLPTAEEIEKEGLNVGMMQTEIVKKIEELTLLLIVQQKQLDEMRNMVKAAHGLSKQAGD